MKTKLFTFAGAVAVLMALGHFYAKPLLAQVRAALVQNIDEPGRNPYQEHIFATCTNSQFCNFDYSTVPAGKRLVVTNITGFIDSNNGTLPNCNISSSIGGSQYGAVYFTGVKGPTGTGTRVFFNQPVHAYYGPGETPHGFLGLVGTGDTFAGGGILGLSGYYVSLP